LLPTNTTIIESKFGLSMRQGSLRLMKLTLRTPIPGCNSMSNDAETYDIMLSSFLKRFLERDDDANTIIVVRADLGLQGGPSAPDYGVQIEASMDGNHCAKGTSWSLSQPTFL
jgi:hypothetical protein